MVSPVTFRPAAVLAKNVVTVDHVSGGRAELGIGAGWKEDEWRAHGFGFPSLADRLAVLGAHLEVVWGALIAFAVVVALTPAVGGMARVLGFARQRLRGVFGWFAALNLGLAVSAAVGFLAAGHRLPAVLVEIVGLLRRGGLRGESGHGDRGHGRHHDCERAVVERAPERHERLGDYFF